MRIYADTSIFSLDELGAHIGAYKVIEQDSFYFRYDLWNIANISQTFVEFYLDSISTNNLFLLSAVNILMGTINSGDLPELISDAVLVPATKSAILNEGVSFLSTNYSGIVVKGNLTCVGTETNPVNLDLSVEIMGDDDNNFQNNEEKFNGLYTYCQRLLIKWANSFASKSDFLYIHLSNYSKLAELETFLKEQGILPESGRFLREPDRKAYRVAGEGRGGRGRQDAHEDPS